MSKALRFLLLLSAFVLLTHVNAHADEANQTDKSESIDITKKLGDSNYLDFGVKIPLPRILISDGVHFFPSTYSAINNGPFMDVYYIQNPGKLATSNIKPVTYKLVREDGTPITLDLSITKHLVWFMFAGFLTLYIFGSLSNKYKKGTGRTSAPKGAGQNMAEVMIIYLRDEVIKTNIGEAKYRKFAPYLLSCFFMILFMNLFGLAPWGVTPTADISITVVLALTTFVITNINGSKDYWKHIFAMPGVPVAMLPLIIVVEILGLFTKPFALAIRLFANMLAGKMLIYSMLGMIFIFAAMFGTAIGLGSSVLWVAFTIFIYALKVFAAFLQAYIFTMFSALFIGMAVEEHDHGHDHHHAETQPVVTH
jgi:F-type H+-transporting ATPase subunit a